MSSTKIPIQVGLHPGKDVLIPEQATSREALTALVAKVKHDEQEITIRQTLKAFPPDGARAMYRALQSEFGMVESRGQAGGFFSPAQPPQEIQVDVDVGVTENIPWGEFGIAAVPGASVLFGVHEENDGTGHFEVSITCQRLWERAMNRAIEVAKELLLTDSIYRGKAFSIDFRNYQDDIVTFPSIKFMDVKSSVPLVFDAEVMQDFQEQVLWPVEGRGKAGVPRVPRGILLVGSPGTGKSQAMRYLARAATEGQKWTVIYCRNLRDLARAVNLARLFGNAVVVGEDVDGVVNKERGALTNEILNVLDGIESKNSEVMVVLTTNHYEKLPEPMTRTGRFDVTFFLAPPQTPEAMSELLRAYSGGLIPEDEDLSEPALKLVKLQLIPSDVTAVVERARRTASYRNGGAAKSLLAADFIPAISALQREREAKRKAMAGHESLTGEQEIRKGLESVGRAIRDGYTTFELADEHYMNGKSHLLEGENVEGEELPF